MKTLEPLAKVSFGILCAAMVVIAFQAMPMADDYCFKTMVEGNSFLGFIYNYYMSWSGRLTSTFLMALTFSGVDIDHLYLVSVFWIFLYLLVVLMVAKTLHHLGVMPAPLWVIANGVLIAFTVPLSRMMSETVYWPTGGAVYVVTYALLAVLLALVAQVASEGRGKVGRKALIITLSFFAGLSLESIAVALLAILGLLALNAIKKKNLAVFWASAAAACGAGMIILVKAPGNQARLKAPGSTPASLDLLHWPQNLAFMVSERGGAFVEPIAGALLVALLLVFLREPGRTVDHSRRRGLIVLLLGAVGAVTLVFSMLGSIVPPRTYSLVVILLAVLGLVFFTGSLNRIAVTSRRRTTALGILVFLNLYFVGFFVMETAKARDVRLELQSRLEKIRQNPEQKRWVFPHVAAIPSRFLHFDDLDVKADHWKNACFVDYLKLEEARTE